MPPDPRNPRLPRTILHVDMDGFFASIEQLDHPELRGKPVLVGGDGPRAVVATASYEARRFGCHSAQPMSIARRLCPQAVIVPVRGGRYHEVSEQIFAIFDRYTPAVEPLSIDEAFLDLTGTLRIHGSGEAAARRIKSDVRHATGGLTCSIGVAPNKFLAKLASDEQKPDGLTVVTPEMLESWLPRLPVGRLWGVGKVTQERLLAFGIRTIGDVASLDPAELDRRFGRFGEHFHRLALGQDDRPVVADSQAQSIGQEHTYAYDVPDPQPVRSLLLLQAEHVGRRLRRHRLKARGVTVKIRYGDFQTITRAATIEEATDSTDRLWQAAAATFDRWVRESFSPVRLIGMAATHLTTMSQPGLFDQQESARRHQVDVATDRIVDRFGIGAIQRAATLDPTPPARRHRSGSSNEDLHPG